MSDKNMTVGNHSVVITDLSKLPSEPCAIAIGEGAMVIGYGTFDDVLRSELIALLNELRIEHYTDLTGVNDCEFVWSNGKCACTCGADEHNAKIDAMIIKLKRKE